MDKHHGQYDLSHRVLLSCSLVVFSCRVPLPCSLIEFPWRFVRYLRPFSHDREPAPLGKW